MFEQRLSCIFFEPQFEDQNAWEFWLRKKKLDFQSAQFGDQNGGQFLPRKTRKLNQEHIKGIL